MPSSMQVATNTTMANAPASCKPPPPNKFPPPPPPPPLPKPPPPPPPRNSSQLNCQGAVQLSQVCGANVGVPQNTNGLLNSGSSMGSLNSAGRCGHSQTIASGSVPSQHCQRNLMKFNDNCSSRSSVSSHSSLQHHLHANINHAIPNPANGPSSFSNMCSHQTNNSCHCQATNSLQHSHINSSSMSDNGSCTYGLDNRSMSSSNCGGCCNCYCGTNSVHHVHNMNSKCQQSQVTLNMSANITRGNSSIGGPTSTTISRSTLFHNNENNNANISSMNNDSRMHCQGSCAHHHHHHALHENQMASNTTMSPLQPVDGSFHRCHAAQSNTISSLPNLMSDQVQRPMMSGHCNHAHRPNIYNHHHQATNFRDHHAYSTNQQPTSHQFNGCSHSHHGRVSPNIMIGKNYATSCSSGRHYPQDSIHANRSSDASNNDSLLSTTHTHNLSNSSTTTHTSNVAVKHQPQSFIHPAPSRGNRSNSSQHYDQYGQSSAASTSSATASLSNYQTHAGSEDLVPLYPSKIHQPLPQPPTRTFNGNSSAINNNMNFGLNHVNNNHVAVMTTTLMNPSPGPQSMHPLPPLPPKTISPNTSSCSTQITTVTSSSSLLNQPITRVTSQAGVQSRLPESDTPPPLPPLNPSSRPQAFVSPQQQLSTAPISSQQITNLNQNRINGPMTEAERKTEILTRQVELELERQRKTGDPHGICFKCGDKVMPAQEACKAMNKIYHASCFVCCECNRTLLGKTFYPVSDKVYCEEDFKYTGHMQSLEKCAACLQPIVDMILTPPAMGKSYHPKCFKCCVCHQCLDGVPFTIDMKDKIYCVKDYHSIYSPKCAACGKSITPIDGTGETVRVVSMEKDYHIDCYCCEDCGLQLTDEEPSQSYPLDNHLLCQRCHINRLSKMQAALTLT